MILRSCTSLSFSIYSEYHKHWNKCVSYTQNKYKTKWHIFWVIISLLASIVNIELIFVVANLLYNLVDYKFVEMEALMGESRKWSWERNILAKWFWPSHVLNFKAYLYPHLCQPDFRELKYTFISVSNVKQQKNHTTMDFHKIRNFFSHSISGPGLVNPAWQNYSRKSQVDFVFLIGNFCVVSEWLLDSRYEIYFSDKRKQR